MNSSSSKDNGDLCKGGHGQEGEFITEIEEKIILATKNCRVIIDLCFIIPEISPSLDMDSCPTGVLIDFSFGNNVEPEPEISEVKEVLSAPSSDNVEYEDTFGLFEEVPPSSPPPLKEREGNQQTTPTLPPPNPKSRTKTVAKGRTHWTHSQPPPLIPPPTEEGEGGPNSSLNSTASPFGLGLGLERKKAKAKVKAVGNVKGVPQRSNSTPLSAAKSLEKRVVDPFSPLFNTSSSTSFTGEGKMGPKNNMETPIKRNKPQDPPTAELLVISGENKWSFSPPGEEQRQKLSQSKLEPQLENNSTPPKRPSVGAANLSDSGKRLHLNKIKENIFCIKNHMCITDSLLDISNLSGFSCSDSEGLLEELVDKLKLPEDDIVQDGGARADYLELERATGVKNKSPSPEKATQDPLVANNNKKDDQDKITAMTAVVNANRRNCDKAEALVESTDYVVREKKRRDSVNSKLQRFSMLMSSQSSPIRSPPTSPKASSEEPEIRNYFPTPSTLAAACTPARRTQSFQ